MGEKVEAPSLAPSLAKANARPSFIFLAISVDVKLVTITRLTICRRRTSSPVRLRLTVKRKNVGLGAKGDYYLCFDHSPIPRQLKPNPFYLRHG